MVYTISLAYAEVPTGEHFVKVRGSSSNIQLVEVVSIGSQLFYATQCCSERQSKQGTNVSLNKA